jgi:hypothetical protein
MFLLALQVLHHMPALFGSGPNGRGVVVAMWKFQATGQDPDVTAVGLPVIGDMRAGVIGGYPATGDNVIRYL